MKLTGEGLARGQGDADQAVVRVGEAQHGVEAKGPQVHRRQERDQLFLAVAEMVFQMNWPGACSRCEQHGQ